MFLSSLGLNQLPTIFFNFVFFWLIGCVKVTELIWKKKSNLNLQLIYEMILNPLSL